MGGIGSGRTGGRPTYESTGSLVLRTTRFARAGLRFGLRGGATLAFTCDGESFPVAVTIDTMDPDRPYIELNHAQRTQTAETGTYIVSLEATPQPFGGLRWWFRCPRTGRRAVRLFLPRGGHCFWSRHAYGLGYASQREDRMGCIQRQGLKAYAALGGQGYWWDNEPPPKPKWMRWATYRRKVKRFNALKGDYDVAWIAGANRILARPLKRR